MQLVFACTYMGLLNVIELILNLFTVVVLGANAIVIGLLNAIWTLVYIPSAYLASKLSDKGSVKKLLMSSVILITSSIAVLAKASSITHISIGFVTHSASIATARLAIMTALLEANDRSKWSSVNKRYVQLVALIEGALLLAISGIGFKALLDKLTLLAFITSLLGVATLLTAPKTLLPIERTLTKLEKTLHRILLPARAITALGYQSLYTPTGYYVFQRIWSMGAEVSLAPIALSLASLRISNEYLFTPLPYFLLRVLNLGIDGALAIYGSAKVIASTALSAIPIEFSGKSRAVLIASLAIRAASATMLLCLGPSPTLLSTSITLIYLTNVFIDMAIYIAFVNATAGYRTAMYTVLSEVASLIGATTSGYILASIGPLGILTAVLLLTIVMATIAQRIAFISNP
ncbi:MAG: hypothetical protein N3E36_04890 [Sulfolobales archaeon]|nr:hypothetical protein [Sulfolobales archaeon]